MYLRLQCINQTDSIKHLFFILIFLLILLISHQVKAKFIHSMKFELKGL